MLSLALYAIGQDTAQWISCMAEWPSTSSGGSHTEPCDGEGMPCGVVLPWGALHERELFPDESIIGQEVAKCHGVPRNAGSLGTSSSALRLEGWLTAPPTPNVRNGKSSNVGCLSRLLCSL